MGSSQQLEINEEAESRTTFRLTQQQGEQLRSLISQDTGMRFNFYVQEVGLQITNVTNYLSGRTRMSIGTLGKLLAGTNLDVSCFLQIRIQPGNDAANADSTSLDEMLFSPELDTQ